MSFDLSAVAPAAIATRASLRADLEALGVVPGDTVMVHAAMRQFGPLLGGPDAFIGALCDAVGEGGTVIGYTSWDGAYEDLLDADGRVPLVWRDAVPPFDRHGSRAVQMNGVFPEFLRTTPGAVRSGNPGASVAAIGARADWIAAPHPLDYGYGPGTPLARLIEGGGKVLMAGAPWDTMTLLHHAEHLAPLKGKNIRRVETPLAVADRTEWRLVEEFDTSEPVVDGLPDNCFELIVQDFVASGVGRQGRVADAAALLVDTTDICRFAVGWLVARCEGAD